MNVLALFMVVGFAAFGGYLVGLLAHPKIKKHCSTVTIPPLVGMIFFGCAARNAFGEVTEVHYHKESAALIRQVCLCVILMRGGLSLKFEGTGLLIVLLTLIPQFVEATTVALLSRWLFALPWTLCFANGFCLAAVSPSVLVPSLMILIEKKMGVKKGIPFIMLAANSFENIITITIFGVLIALSFDSISGGHSDIGSMVGMNILYIAVGLVVGSLLGLTMKFVKGANNYIKFAITLTLALTAPFFTKALGFEKSKYVGVIFFGYATYRVWGKAKPDALLASFWKICQPFLFGTIGASIQVSKIDGKVFGYSVLVILVGGLFRVCVTYFVTAGTKLLKKERAFIAFGWSPKATVQAAIGGIALDHAMKLTNVPADVKDQYIEYGNIMLSTAVLAIMITAPVGAILINTLGLKWLECNDEEESQSAKPCDEESTPSPQAITQDD